MTEELKTRPQRNTDRMEAAVSGARQRLLEADQPKVPTTTTAEPKLSGEFIQHSSGARVPREFYDLSPDAQKRFLASLEQKQEEAAAESRFDQSRCGCSMRWTSSGVR